MITDCLIATPTLCLPDAQVINSLRRSLCFLAAMSHPAYEYTHRSVPPFGDPQPPFHFTFALTPTYDLVALHRLHSTVSPPPA